MNDAVFQRAKEEILL